MKHILISVIHIIIPKCVVLKNVHKMKSGQINHGMRGIQQFSGNAIRQKSLAHAGVTVKEKIPGLLIEMINEIVTGTENGLDILSGTDAKAAVLRIGIIPDVKGIEILAFQHIMDVGLAIEKIDHSLLKTVTFLVTDKTGIMTIRA